MLRGKNVIKNRILAGVLATTLAVSIFGGVAYFNGNEAFAKPTLKGIEELVESHSAGSGDTNPTPFIILEVVPSLSDAKFGYLVGGEEPVYEGKSIKDMPSKAERTMRFDEVSYDPTGLDIYGSAFSWKNEDYRYKEPDVFDDDDEVRSLDIKGTFIPEENGWYDTTDITSDYVLFDGNVEDIYDDNNTEGVVLYRKTQAYRMSSGYTGSYAFNLRLIADALEMPVEVETGIYNSQYFVASEVGASTDFSEDVVLFKAEKLGSGEFLEYAGVVRIIGDELMLIAADDSQTKIGTEAGELFDEASIYNYYSVQESSESGQNLYRIDGAPISGGPYGMKLGFSRVEGEIYTSTNAPVEKGPYYVASGSSDEYSFISDKSGNYNFVADYSLTDVYQSVRYAGGFKNSEWFKQNVLDREPGAECDNLIVDVVPVTVDMLADKIDNANLVYFAGGYTASDLSAETAIKVVNKVAEDDLPVILEYSTYSSAKTAGFPNFQKMALCLMQNAISHISGTDAWDNLNYNDPAASGYLLKTTKFYNADAAKMDAEANDISYVSGTIFMNDDIYTSGTGVVAPDFNDSYGKEKRETNFKDILDEYEREKPYIELYDDWSKFNSTVSKATSIRYILNSHKNRAVVKSKLNVLDIEPYATSQYADQSELETNVYKNGRWISARYTLTRDTMTKEWISTNLAEHLKGKENDSITLRQMGTKEFVGKNDDLNSDYDLIYIGMDTALMNTSGIDNNDTGTKKKSVSPVYNFRHGDWAFFDKLIYAHLGDRFNVLKEWGNPVDQLHTAGNDITSDKVRELTEYVQAGYALILSDSFFDLNSADVRLNDDTLDNTSNMHKFLMEVLAKDGTGNYMYYGKNVFRRGALESGTIGYDRARSTIAKYLNISKLTIETISAPNTYDGDALDNYIPMNADGTHTMRFEVKLTNDAAVDASSTTYDCKLYLDLDADGKFEDGEALGGLEVDGQSAERFELKSGNTYTITRNTPDEYVGFLSWKLAFVQNEKETGSASTSFNNVRSAITGFSAVQNTGKKPPIDVLQITPNPGQQNNLDLTSEPMQTLYTQVKDFTVSVHAVTVGDYIQKKDRTDTYDAREMTYYDYLSQFDMVVIGFADDIHFEAPENGGRVTVCYPDWWRRTYGGDPAISRENAYYDAILGIREYVLSGQSILFTHDLSSRVAFDTYYAGGFYANKYLSDVMGMDRYGRRISDNESLSYKNDYKIKLGSNDQGGTDSYKLKKYDSVYDFYQVKGQNASEIFGFTEANILRSATNAGANTYRNAWGITTRGYTNLFDIKDEDVPKNNTTWKETVTALNEGQITQYPFRITSGTSGEKESQFEVASTHPQYFQLNLDTDSRDDNTNDDVVVWYTISNDGSSSGSRYTNRHKFYQALYGDARNNYYIYSKGNVTYTGSGHAAVTSDKERKLFVNTLVAAYSSGLHSPKVIFKENPWDSAANITSTCLPYDPKLTNTEELTDKAAVEADEGGFITDTVKVNFKTINNNFRESKNNLYVEYYLQTTEGSDIVIDGVSYKTLNPTSIKVDTGTGSLTDVGDAHVLANYKVYQASFRLADINISQANKLNKENAKIWVRISTVPIEDPTTIAATESISPFEITAMKLYDLK
ncbi:MAG: DUF5057 domain-containing protein [Lachnospiraceae bacterium]|nr:DUF5057 domain-containing protein [Candidatus Colinaster scatohippi]